MREYGLPERIRADNGCPFASTSVRGLSKLSVKWIKLGIVHERIEPGEPQQNGRHERKHRTLKQETAKPPAFTLREQQARFNEFRKCYNEVRTQEALEFSTPCSVYVASARTYPLALSDPEYDDRFVLRRVHKDGDIKMQGTSIFISESLRNETVGLLQIEDDRYELYFGNILLGEVDTYWKNFARAR